MSTKNRIKLFVSGVEGLGKLVKENKVLYNKIIKGDTNNHNLYKKYNQNFHTMNLVKENNVLYSKIIKGDVNSKNLYKKYNKNLYMIQNHPIDNF